MKLWQDYNSYAIEGTKYDEVFRELQVTFEACSGNGCKAVNETEAYLEDKEFKFPYRESFFNLDSSDDSVKVEETNDKLVYPFLKDFMLEMSIELEQGIIRKNNDMTGLNYLFGVNSLERFFLVGDV